jgi:hypothetical protein
MRHPLFPVIAAFVAGGIVTGAALSFAQPKPPTATADVMSPPQERGGWGHGPGAMMHRRAEMLRSFALVYTQQDRALSPSDVQKIAEAFLLWHGNHSWKVTDVAAQPDGAILFSLATADGATIAKFTMDPHTARIQRVS